MVCSPQHVFSLRFSHQKEHQHAELRGLLHVKANTLAGYVSCQYCDTGRLLRTHNSNTLKRQPERLTTKKLRQWVLRTGAPCCFTTSSPNAKYGRHKGIVCLKTSLDTNSSMTKGKVTIPVTMAADHTEIPQTLTMSIDLYTSYRNYKIHFQRIDCIWQIRWSQPNGCLI